MRIEDVDMSTWRWPNFTPYEVGCKDGTIVIHEPSMDCLQAFRNIRGIPFTPNSAYRSPAYNASIGGAKHSMHLLGRAYDIPILPNMSREQIHDTAREVGFTGFGDYNTFVHIDTGRPRYWDLRT